MRLIDKIGEWLQDSFGANAQLRLDVFLVLVSVPLYLYLPFSGEPPVIYAMSAVAITISGISVVVSAEVLKKEEDR